MMIHIFCGIVSVIYQVFQSNGGNLDTIELFQVFLSNRNNYIVSSN